MAEVQAVTPTSSEPVVEATFDQKLAKKLGLDQPDTQDAPAPKEAPPATSEDVPADELSADDLPSDDEGQPGDEGWLEVERKGVKRRLTKDEAKQFAQKGLDYDILMQETKADKEAIAQEKQALQAKAQLTPQVIDAAANVRYFERALQQFMASDSAKINPDSDIIGYMQAKATLDQLKEGYNGSVWQFQQAQSAVQQVDAVITQAELKQALSVVQERAPDLRDPQKFTAETGRIRAYLTELGVPQQRQDSLSDPVEFLIVRDAMRYRQAVKAKAERQNPATPSLRPGPAPVRQSADTQKAELTKQLHQAKDPARKRELFDKLLAAKLGNRY